jgi:hypothetical protein
MIDSKFIITLIGIVIAILAICNIKKVEAFTSIIESFGMNPSMTWKVDRMVASNENSASKGHFYSVPGTYQAILNPRFSNVNYGANIRYNMPSHANQASPYNPLTFGNMAKEGYTREKYSCGSCGGGCFDGCNNQVESTSYQGGAPLTPVNYASGNYNKLVEKEYGNSSYQEVSSTLPVGNMTTVNADGETIQPIVYDRFIYANRNSRLRSQGDPIRGDLPIVPSSSDWFRPSVHPSIDLQEGAMHVMGGHQNQTSNDLSQLIYASSGNVNNNRNVNMNSTFTQSVSGGMRDVQVTAFP